MKFGLRTTPSNEEERKKEKKEEEEKDESGCDGKSNAKQKKTFTVFLDLTKDIKANEVTFINKDGFPSLQLRSCSFPQVVQLFLTHEKSLLWTEL